MTKKSSSVKLTQWSVPAFRVNLKHSAALIPLKTLPTKLKFELISVIPWKFFYLVDLGK